MKYIVKTSAANMGSGKRGMGHYGNVAVLLVEDGAEPKMISERAKGVIEIVSYEGKLHWGSTEKCAFRKALARAEALAAKLNDELTNGTEVPQKGDSK